MNTKLGCYRHKILVFWIVILLLGIFGMFVNATASEPNSAPEYETGSRSGESRGTTIGQYLQLWDTYYNQPHDGVYGDGDPGDYNNFYLNTDTSLYIYLKNIYTQGYRFENIEANLKVGTGSGDLITLINKYDSEYSMYPNEVDNFYFSFNIGTYGFMKPYELQVTVNFDVVDTSYNVVKEAGNINFYIQLSSRIKSTTSSSALKLQAIDRYHQPVDLYSGAKNQLVSLYQIYSATGYLEDVEITLSLPSTFTILTKEAYVESLDTSYYSNEDPLWLFDDVGSVYEKAKEYSGKCKVTYGYSGSSVTERDVPIKIEIDKTPILSLEGQMADSEIGSTAGGNFVSNAAIYQSTTSKSFTLGFKNTGNIDLREVEVELFTDDASFFFKSKFYYDESNYARKESYGKTIKLGDVSQGQLVTKGFSTEIIRNLPPGLYKIPIKYSAKYNPTGYIDIDLDENDYHDEITAARSEYNEGYLPFILVNVLEGDDKDDQNEPDLSAVSTTHLQPGMRSIDLEVELTNLENYRLENVNALIEADEDCPLRSLDYENETFGRIYPQEKEFTMYGANEESVLNKRTLHFVANVRNDATPGLCNVPIKVTCYDSFNQFRETQADLHLNIQPIPPKFIISNTETTDIKPNKNFTLTIDVYNSGGSDAKNVQLMFNGSSNLFSSTKRIQGPLDIDRLDSGEFSFEVEAGEIEPGTTYMSSIFIRYEDSMGNIYNFDPDLRLTVPLHAMKPDPHWAPRFVVSNVATSDIKPNEDFTLKIDLMNCGGSDANDVRIMFNGSSNLFSVDENIQTTKTITRNHHAEFVFKVKAGEIEPGEVYSSSVFVSFEDVDGEFYSFDSNPEQLITLRADKPESEPWVIQEGVALVVLALFILIGAIIIGFFRGRGGASKERPSRGPRPESRVPEPTEPKKKRFGGWSKKKSEVIDMSAPSYQEQPSVTTTPSQAQQTAYTPPKYPAQEPQSYQSRAEWQASDQGYTAPAPRNATTQGYRQPQAYNARSSGVAYQQAPRQTPPNTYY